MRMYKGILLVMAVTVTVLTGCRANPSEEGLTFLQEEQYDAAISKFEEAIDENINIADAYQGIGIAKWELEDYEGARDAFLKAQEHEDESTAVLFNFLGNCELKLENYETALSYFSLGMEKADCSEEMLRQMRFNEIVCYEALEEWDDAQAKLKEYTKDYPDDERAAKEAEFWETR